VRTLARSVADAYYASREALGFPLVRAADSESFEETAKLPAFTAGSSS
jgi:hypothetical protein